MAHKTVEEPQYLTVAEVGVMFRIGRRKMYELARQGRIPFTRIDHALRFERKAVERWFRDNGVVPVKRLREGAGDLGNAQPAGSPA